MTRKTILTAVLAALAGSVASAQDARVEISGLAGWTYSDGVTGASIIRADGNTYNAIAPKDSFSWGLRLGILASENVELGFLFDQQQSKLQVEGTASREIGDLPIYNYHGYLAYNFGDADAKARFYLLGGLGATNWGGLTFTATDGSTREISGQTKFSTTWGAGIKIFPGPKFGLRFEGRWTPTYVKSDAEGWWCDPYWGCYVVEDAQYSNQFELSGGITLRF